MAYEHNDNIVLQKRISQPDGFCKMNTALQRCNTTLDLFARRGHPLDTTMFQKRLKSIIYVLTNIIYFV